MMSAKPSPQFVNFLVKVTPMATKEHLIRRVSENVSDFSNCNNYHQKVLTNWTFHQQTQKKSTDKDFKELNRAAIKNKATTSDQQYNFRQSVNLRLKDPAQRRELQLSIGKFDENTRFGTANRPSTPIKAVVEGFFGDVAAQ